MPRRDARRDTRRREPTRQLRPDERDGLRTPPHAEAEQRRQARLHELTHEHWQAVVCGRGHRSERHRGTHLEGPCPICHEPTRVERAEETLRVREEEEARPERRVAQLVDLMTTWATERLNANTWTQLSEQWRERLARTQRISQQPGVADVERWR